MSESGGQRQVRLKSKAVSHPEFRRALPDQPRRQVAISAGTHQLFPLIFIECFLRAKITFLPYLPSRLAPCIRPDVKSLVSLDSPDRRATKSRTSVFEAKSCLFKPLSPCVPVCPGFLAGLRIAAASLSGPRPGPSVSGPTGPDASYCAIWSDGSRFCPSRLQCHPAAI